jgi:hypothetical protein
MIYTITLLIHEAKGEDKFTANKHEFRTSSENDFKDKLEGWKSEVHESSNEYRCLKVLTNDELVIHVDNEVGFKEGSSSLLDYMMGLTS